MKRILSFLGLLLIVVSPTQAHPYAPLSAYLPSAQNICVAKVTSVHGDKIIFAVGEVLRGHIASSLTLTAMYGSTFAPESEWLLVSCSSGYGNGSVGFAIEGDCDWIPGAIRRTGSTLFVESGTFLSSGIVLDTAPDGTKGLTLEHVKSLLKEQSPKP